jgi:HK97 gp10 family phage protein
MPTGITIRADVGGTTLPKLRRYRYGQRTTGTKLTAARIGASIVWKDGINQLGGWLSGALVDTLIQEVEETIRRTAPVGPDPPDHPAWSGHVHMKDSINSTLRVNGRNVRGRPDAASASYAYGEVFVGFPWRFLEYGTVKMSARPFVEPAYEATMARWRDIALGLINHAIS